MRLLRALSLDVVAGAACGGLLAEHMTRARMFPGWWVALLTAVWCIYTGDHLLDARRADGGAATRRHAFHRRRARLLSVALVAAVIVGLAAASTLRPPVRLFGIGLSLAAVAYLASAQGLILPNLPKEPVAGVLYAAGIWGGPIVMGEGPRDWLLLAAAFHALAAILNLVMLGVFEAAIDGRLGQRSLALRWGRAAARGRAISWSASGSIASLVIAALEPRWRDVFAILAIQIATPVVLLGIESWSSKEERYRLWGDSVFLLGAIPRLLR